MNARQAHTIRAGIVSAQDKKWSALSMWRGDRYYRLFRRAFMRTDLREQGLHMGASLVVKPRRGTTAQWEAVNPVLRPQELGLDFTRGIVRIGDGTTRWNGLPDFTGSDTDPLTAQ